MITGENFAEVDIHFYTRETLESITFRALKQMQIKFKIQGDSKKNFKI